MPSQTNVIILKAAVYFIPLRIYVTINWFAKVMPRLLPSHKNKDFMLMIMPWLFPSQNRNEFRSSIEKCN